jgi:hypothetical protein
MKFRDIIASKPVISITDREVEDSLKHELDNGNDIRWDDEDGLDELVSNIYDDLAFKKVFDFQNFDEATYEYVYKNIRSIIVDMMARKRGPYAK